MYMYIRARTYKYDFSTAVLQEEEKEEKVVKEEYKKDEEEEIEIMHLLLLTTRGKYPLFFIVCRYFNKIVWFCL